MHSIPFFHQWPHWLKQKNRIVPASLVRWSFHGYGSYRLSKALIHTPNWKSMNNKDTFKNSPHTVWVGFRQQEPSLRLRKKEQSIILTVQCFWPRCSSTHWYLFSLTVLRGSTSAANRRLSSAYSWPERQPANRQKKITPIPTEELETSKYTPEKRPWCVVLHKSGYHTTHQITKTEEGFLPGHNRVSSLREETVSSDNSMVVALPSNILPENKRSLDLPK